MLDELPVLPAKTGFGGDTLDHAHPAGSALVVVDRARLARFPAQHQRVELRPVGQQVAAVALVGKVNLFGQQVDGDIVGGRILCIGDIAGGLVFEKRPKEAFQSVLDLSHDP